MNKYIKTKDLFSTQNKLIKPFLEKFEYPWEALPEIKGYIKELIKNGIEGYTLIGEDVLVGEMLKFIPPPPLKAPQLLAVTPKFARVHLFVARFWWAKSA